MGSLCSEPEDKSTQLENENNSANKARTGNKEVQVSGVELDALSAHNTLRKKHGSPPLVINKELNAVAQKWADTLAATDSFEHSECQWKGESIGENIAMCQGQEMTGQLATQMWYDEIKDYNFKNPGFSSETGHFTQLVWKDSKEIGVGLALSKSGCYYCVANYFPPGNFQDEFEQNVLRS